MTVEEVKEAKRHLESAIEFTISEWNKKTGCHVRSIEIKYTWHHYNHGSQSVESTRIDTVVEV